MSNGTQLNKGLNKSLGNLQAVLTKAQQGGAYHELELGNIDPYKGQLRTDYNEEALNDLAATIKEHGVQQDILVRPKDGGRYEIIAGERRWRASKIAGKATIPAKVKNISDEEAEAIHRIENVHRENLSTRDMVTALRNDMAKYKSQAKVASLWTKSESWVSKMLSLESLGDVTQTLVSENLSADREVLADVNRLEKQDPVLAANVVEEIRTSGPKANVRDVVRNAKEQAKVNKQPAGKGSALPSAKNDGKAGKAPVKAEDPRHWKVTEPVELRANAVQKIGVEMDTDSPLYREFADLTKKHGDPVLAPGIKHKTGGYAWVRFGRSKQLVDFPLDCLRVVFVE